jgi:hypothetical protein
MYAVNGAKYYVHQNHLFSVSAVTDAAGTTRERYSYTSYGDRRIYGNDGSLVANSAYSNLLSFNGLSIDSAIGDSLYARGRWLSGKLGAFLSRDSWNREYALAPRSELHRDYVDGLSLYKVYHVERSSLDPWGYYTINASCCCYIDQAIAGFENIIRIQNDSISEEDSLRDYSDRLKREANPVDGGTAFIGATNRFGRPACITEAINRIEEDTLISVGRGVMVFGGIVSGLMGTVTGGGKNGAINYMALYLHQEKVAHGAVLHELQKIKAECAKKRWCCSDEDRRNFIGPLGPDGSM